MGQINETLLKALEPYSGAFLISVIWGEIAPEKLNKYRAKIHRRLTGKVEFEKLEVEKLNNFLKNQSAVIAEYLHSV
jgi:hypothetical protein